MFVDSEINEIYRTSAPPSRGSSAMLKRPSATQIHRGNIKFYKQEDQVKNQGDFDQRTDRLAIIRHNSENFMNADLATNNESVGRN